MPWAILIGGLILAGFILLIAGIYGAILSGKREDIGAGREEPTGIGAVVTELRAKKAAEGHLVTNPTCYYYDGSREWSMHESCPVCHPEDVAA